MKLWNAIFNILGIVLILIMLIVFNKMITTNERQFEQIRLSYAVDYAVDAALSAGVHAGSNRTDSVNAMETVQINMNNLLPTFDNLMAMSYDMSLDDDSFLAIEQSIATGVLCTVNGYYILEEYEVDNAQYDASIGGEYNLLWGLKRPYLCYIRDGDGNVQHLYSLNLLNEESVEFLSVESGDFSGAYRLEHRYSYAGTGITNEIRKQVIGQLLTEDLNIAINARNNGNVNKQMNYFYMPSNDSLSAINDIETPTLLFIIQDSTLLNGMNLNSARVAGARVRPRRTVIGFTLDNEPKPDAQKTKYYCYEGQQILGSDRLDGDITVIKSFPSMQKAAEEGYMPHFSLLSVAIP